MRLDRLQRIASGQRGRLAVPRRIAQTVAGHELRRPEDLLRIIELYRVASPREIARLFVQPLSVEVESPRVATHVAQLEQWSGCLIGSWESLEGVASLYLGHPHGELISAELESGGRLDYATVRFLGIPTWRLPRLDAAQRQDLYARLHSTLALRAGRLWREGADLDVPNRALVRQISLLLRALQTFTRIPTEQQLDAVATGTDLTGPGSGTISPPAGTVTPTTNPDSEIDGCDPSWLPDLNLTDCCNAHDQCYIDGCTSCDRLECDEKLFDCIAGKGRGTPDQAMYLQLAMIFYVGVRTFGDSHFVYCDGRGGLPITPLTAACAVGGAVAGATVAAMVVGGPESVALPGGPELAGAAAGAAVGVVVCRYAGELLCHVCDWAEDWLERCKDDVEERVRECRARYERRKKACKKKRFWKRWACRLSAWIKRWSCEIVLKLIQGACWLVFNGVKLVTC